MTNPTALKFGYPGSQVAETAHWRALVRPAQPTLGSLVLVCKQPVEAFSDVSLEGHADLKAAITGIETMLSAFVGYDRINYLMLMMVDRDVHFHVLPRYDGTREHEGLAFADAGWPGPPSLDRPVMLDAKAVESMAHRLAALWPKSAS